jgi:hypothetical protein
VTLKRHVGFITFTIPTKLFAKRFFLCLLEKLLSVI